MAVRFGIYIGNTSCSIAIFKNGKTSIVANAAGDRVTPAVIALHNDEVVAGAAAKQGIIRYGQSTIQNILCAFGTKNNEEINTSCLCPVTWEKGQPYFSVLIDDKTKKILCIYFFEQIFYQLKEIAVGQTSEEELQAVISLPIWASEEAVTAVKNAATKAGFIILSTISQPAAACLAYDLLNCNTDHNLIMVLHCGGTTVAGCLVEVSGGLLVVKDSLFISNKAGNGIIQLLVEHFAKEFYNKFKGNPLENRRSRQKLYIASENCKHVLSTLNSAQVYVESLWEGVDFSTNLSLARFNDLAKSSIMEFLHPMTDLVTRNNYKLEEINKVILTGGTSRIPKLQHLAKELFKQADLLCSIPTDEVLALGAAAESAFSLNHKDGSEDGDDGNTVPAIGSAVFCKLRHQEKSICVFSKGTPIYSKSFVSLPLENCQQDAKVSLIIYEHKESSTTLDQEQILAEVSVPVVPGVSTQLQLDIRLRSDGSMAVIIKERARQLSKSFVIDPGS